jgi:hypothetical protein
LMRQKLSRDQRGVAILELFLVVAIFSVVGFIGYRVYLSKNPPLGSSSNTVKSLSSKSTYGFGEDITLPLYKTVTLKDGNELIKFRFTELQPARDPNAKCEELCREMLPTINIELEYSGKTFKGTSSSESTPNFDMSFEENGAYPLIPYNVELVRSNLPHSGTIKITKNNFMKVELGKQFTLKNGGIAALPSGKTGVHIIFGTCGISAHCMRDVDFYVDDEWVSVPLGFADVGASPALQFASKDGNFVEHNDIRLRLIESDDTTYATFVLEKK